MVENLVGEFILRRRNELDMSLRDVAAAAGISHSQISKIESGQAKKPTRESLEKIAYALRVDKGEFLALAGFLDDDVRDEVMESIKSYHNEVAVTDSKSMFSGAVLGGILGAMLGMAATSENLLDNVRNTPNSSIELLKLYVSLYSPSLSEEDVNNVAKEMEAAYLLTIKRLEQLRKPRGTQMTTKSYYKSHTRKL